MAARRPHHKPARPAVVLALLVATLYAPAHSTARAAPEADPWTPAGPVAHMRGAVAALVAHPTRPSTFAAVERAVATGRWVHLGSALEKRVADSPSPSAHVALAHWRLRRGDHVRALATLREHVEGRQGPAGVAALFAEALAAAADAQAASDPARALRLRLEAWPHVPARARAKDVSTILHLAKRARQLRETLAFFERNLQPADKRSAAPHLAQAHAWLGEFDQAAGIAKAAGASAPPGIPVNVAPRAEPTHRRKAERGGDGANALADAAEARLAAGDEAGALRIYQRLATLHPGFHRGIVALGQLHHRQGRRLMAFETWRRLLRLAAPDTAALDLATLLFEHQELEEADTYARSAAKSPTVALDARRLLARIASARGQAEEAAALWRSVHADAPEERVRAEAHARLGSLAPHLGATARARLLTDLEDAWRVARGVDARSRAAQVLATVQAALGLPDEALATLKDAQREVPASIAIAQQAVTLLKQGRQTAEALRWLSAVVDALPREAFADLAWTLREMADLHDSRGELDGARTLLERAQTLAPSSRQAIRLAHVYERLQSKEPRAATLARAQLAPWVARGDAAATRAELELLSRQGSWHEAFDAARASAERGAGGEADWDVVLQLCVAQPCLHALEHALATQIAPSTDVDEVHLRLLDRIVPDLAVAAAQGDGSAQAQLQRVADAGAAPLARYLASAAEAPSDRLILAGYLGRTDLAAIVDARARGWLQRAGTDSRTQNLARAHAALWALAQLRAGLSLDLAEAALQASQQARLLALYALGAAGCGAAAPAAHAATPTQSAALLVAALQARVESEAAVATWALAQLEDDLAAKTVRAALKDAHGGQAARAMSAAFTRAPQDVPALAALAGSLRETLAEASIAGLARVGSAEARAALWLVALEADPRRSRLALAGLRNEQEPACVSLPAPPAAVDTGAWLAAAMTASGNRSAAAALAAVSQDDGDVIEALLQHRLETAGPQAQARMLNRVARLVTGGALRPPSPELAARLEAVALAGPEAARPAAVALRAAARAQVTSLEIVRAMAAADAEGDEATPADTAAWIAAAAAPLAQQAEPARALCQTFTQQARPSIPTPRRWLALQLKAAFPGCARSLLPSAPAKPSG